MKTLVLIPARMASSRLPNKVVQDIGGYSSLEHVTRRARRSGYAVAICAPASEAPLFSHTIKWRNGVPDRRGRKQLVPIYHAELDENDVLGRLYYTARWANDMSSFTGGEGYGCIVRLTPDCPFVPVEGIDSVAEFVTSGKYDYAETRSDPSARPNGIDAQAFTYEVLERAWAASKGDEVAREHVTPALLGAARAPGRIAQIEDLWLDKVGSWRITLDTPDDYEALKRVADELTVDPSAGRPTLTELAALHSERPELFLAEPVA